MLFNHPSFLFRSNLPISSLFIAIASLRLISTSPSSSTSFFLSISAFLPQTQRYFTANFYISQTFPRLLVATPHRAILFLFTDARCDDVRLRKTGAEQPDAGSQRRLGRPLATLDEPRPREILVRLRRCVQVAPWHFLEFNWVTADIVGL